MENNSRKLLPPVGKGEAVLPDPFDQSHWEKPGVTEGLSVGNHSH